MTDSMHEYLTWQEQTITDFSDENINTMYNRGFVFTRLGSGMMQQTRSLRIDLSKFELSSENRRILRKTEDLKLTPYSLPFENYDWQIGKMGKDFYDEKFGKGTMSANKVKEMMTDQEFKNFNKVLQYVIPTAVEGSRENYRGLSTPLRSGRDDVSGYAICLETNEILHYSYPFYNLQSPISNLGLGMMLKAITYAKESGKKYIYLGSFQRPGDVYKLQFSGFEWFDGKEWSDAVQTLKIMVQR
jgi:arginyl-tRNA--protein-N-Asp/Glu arginylyltransferase